MAARPGDEPGARAPRAGLRSADRQPHGEPHQHAIAPIDDCYRLVGMIKTSWEGISGGTGPELAIAQFFAELRVKASPGQRRTMDESPEATLRELAAARSDPIRPSSSSRSIRSSGRGTDAALRRRISDGSGSRSTRSRSRSLHDRARQAQPRPVPRERLRICSASRSAGGATTERSLAQVDVLVPELQRHETSRSRSLHLRPRGRRDQVLRGLTTGRPAASSIQRDGLLPRGDEQIQIDAVPWDLSVRHDLPIATGAA